MHRALRSVCLLLLTACGASSPGADPAMLEILTAEGVETFQVEIADSQLERRTGLMGRETLDPFDGMAFVWDEPVQGSFWMKDTLIPLSIAFWDEGGRIIAILDMDPCVADPCPTYGPPAPFIGAVEVRQGAFRLRSVEVGDRVELHLARV
jgi:uncharacterized protein